MENNDILSFNNCDLSQPITLKQFKRATGLSTKQVKKALEELKKKNIIREFMHTQKGVMYMINYDLDSMNLEGVQNDT